MAGAMQPACSTSGSDRRRPSPHATGELPFLHLNFRSSRSVTVTYLIGTNSERADSGRSEEDMGAAESSNKSEAAQAWCVVGQGPRGRLLCARSFGGAPLSKVDYTFLSPLFRKFRDTRSGRCSLVCPGTPCRSALSCQGCCRGNTNRVVNRCDPTDNNVVATVSKSVPEWPRYQRGLHS